MNAYSKPSLPRKRLTWKFDEPTALLKWGDVATVCEESRCPNRNECSSAGIATFMIGGKQCTRACRFCHVDTARPGNLRETIVKEETELLQAVDDLRLRYVVITSVARDDDELLLAGHFANLTRQLNGRGIETELLIPDFHVREDCLQTIGEAQPLVVAHNMETVERLTQKVRPQAAYQRTLEVFDYFHENHPDVILKSGFMVGLGETRDEILQLLQDLRERAVEIITIGQYMRPGEHQLPVDRQYTENEFSWLEKQCESLNFAGWEVGAFVRSSYMAARTMEQVKKRRE